MKNKNVDVIEKKCKTKMLKLEKYLKSDCFPKHLFFYFFRAATKAYVRITQRFTVPLVLIRDVYERSSLIFKFNCAFVKQCWPICDIFVTIHFISTSFDEF